MVNSGVGSECQENRQKQVTSELLLSEIQNQTDLLSLSGRTLCVTAGASLSPISSPSTLLCQYINLQLLNAETQECLTGTVGTLLLENPLGQNGLTHQGLVHEAAKVFGLRSRRLRLFLNETQTQGEAAVTVSERCQWCQ